MWKAFTNSIAFPIVLLSGSFFVGIGMVVISVYVPSKWDNATAIKICRDGTVILRLTDGTTWARINGFRHYRVENVETVCVK